MDVIEQVGQQLVAASCRIMELRFRCLVITVIDEQPRC